MKRSIPSSRRSGSLFRAALFPLSERRKTVHEVLVFHCASGTDILDLTDSFPLVIVSTAASLIHFLCLRVVSLRALVFLSSFLELHCRCWSIPVVVSPGITQRIASSSSSSSQLSSLHLRPRSLRQLERGAYCGHRGGFL